VRRQDFAAAVADGTVAETLRRIPVRAGQCYYLPSGTVHALGAGVVVAEVQTPSDTTYRVFDWNRLGDDGKPAPMGLVPTLEETLDQKIFAIGTAEDVAEQIAWYDEQIGLENLLLFPGMPGDKYEDIEEQLGRLAGDVLPMLG